MSVHGEVAEGLEAVRDAFAELEEPGAAVAAYVDGRQVVDLWTGSVGRDSLVHTFSVAKPFAAMCALILVDRGALELDAPVTAYWPEYGQAGKAATTVRHVLAHQAGLLALRESQPAEVVLDWERTIALLEAEAPFWEPGTAHGEHAYFYGHLVGELARRVDGRGLGTFLREEVAEPWDLDFHVGLRAAERARVTPLTDPGGRWATEDHGSLYRLALGNPPGLRDLSVLNGDAWRAAEIPAVNGHGTARGIARFYGGLARGGELDGVRLLGAATLAEALRPQAGGHDVLLDRDATWGLGFAVEDGGFGMGGTGGSLGWAHPDRRLGYAYVTTRLGDHDRAEHVERALLGAL